MSLPEVIIVAGVEESVIVVSGAVDSVIIANPAEPDSVIPSAPGPRGNPGSAGADSTVPGPKGADSIVPGPRGADSVVPGPKGDKGDTGAASVVPGPAGAASTVPGPAGADSTVPGPKGDTGAASVVPGPKGDTGAASTVPGPAGAASTVPGPKGDTGAASTVPGPAGADSVVPGPKGDPGATGAASVVPGPKGDTGAASTVAGPAGPVSTVPGPKGDAGVGVPVGGTTGQVLSKTSAADFATQWIPPAAGGGGVPAGGVDGQLLGVVASAPAWVAAPTGSGGSNLADAFKGPWSATTTYARGDVVSKPGRLWVADSANTAVDPEAVPGFVGAITGTYQDLWTGQTAQPFTVNATVSITAIAVQSTRAGITVGIANDFANTSVVPWLGKGVLGVSAGGWTTVFLDTPVTLVPGTAYCAVVAGDAGAVRTMSPVATGIVVSVGGTRYGATYQAVLEGFATLLQLTSGPNPKWSALLAGSAKRTVDGTAPPTTGDWLVGDQVRNTAPTAGGFTGWVCTTAGTPGTWNGFGADTINASLLTSGTLADARLPVTAQEATLGATYVPLTDARLTDARAPLAHNQAASTISDSTSVGRAVLTAADAAAARTAIGAGTSSVTLGTTAGTAADAGAVATSLVAKAPLASPAFTGTPTGITKTHVGLPNVDNTTDALKPISTATATALALKAVDTTVVHDTGAETIAGIKTFTSAPVVPDASFTIAKISAQSFPPVAQNTNAPTDPASSYPLGITTQFVYPVAGWPLATVYGTLVTTRSYADGPGGTIQYWSSYQTNTDLIYYRQWFYNATAWTAWKRVGASLISTATLPTAIQITSSTTPQIVLTTPSAWFDGSTVVATFQAEYANHIPASGTQLNGIGFYLYVDGTLRERIGLLGSHDYIGLFAPINLTDILDGARAIPAGAHTVSIGVTKWSASADGYLMAGAGDMPMRLTVAYL